MTASNPSALADLVAALPEVYHPIYGHPELSGKAARACDDRLRLVRNVYLATAGLRDRPLRVLDLGCAQGCFSLSLAELGAQVTGIDVLPQNIAVCRALAAEHLSLQVDFAESSIESVLQGLQPGAYDLVVGLSVFHHLVHAHGVVAARNFLGTLARSTDAGIFELALDAEPLPWAASQPADERELLGDFAFVHELGRFPTHLSDVTRPLFFASNRLWYLEGQTREFESWKETSHALEAGVHLRTRRYFEDENVIAKLFRLSAGFADKNLEELDREARFLAKPPGRLAGLPKLILHGANPAESWLVRERIPGKLLLEIIRRGEPYDARRVIRDVLTELCTLEAERLFHNDVRVWNVVLAPDGSASLLDFGSISPERKDCVWPDDPIMSFWIFVREVATGAVDRVIPQRQPFMSPFSIPAEFRDWALMVWDKPLRDWSFSLLLDRLDRSERGSVSSHASASTRWMGAIEKHLDTMGSRAAFVEARAEEHEQRLERIGRSLTELGNGKEWAAAIGAQDETLRSGFEHLNAQLAALAGEVERARRTTSALGDELSASRQEMRQLAERVVTEDLLRTILAQVSADHRQIVERMEAIHAQAAQSAARESKLGQALAESGLQYSAVTRELMAVSAAYLEIERSHSWRITKPLRVANRSVRGAAARTMRGTSAIWQLPRRAVRKLLFLALRYIRANPRRKEQAARLLAHTGGLNAFLRRFARGNPEGGMPVMGHYAPGQYAAPATEREPSSGVAPSPADTEHGGSSDRAQGAGMAANLRHAVANWRVGKRLNV